MNKTIIIAILLLVVLLVVFDKNAQHDRQRTEIYPWQITILPDGKSRVFGIVLDETLLKEVSRVFNSEPELAIFESKGELVLEAFYKNISFAGLSGDFVFIIDATKAELNKLKAQSTIQKRTASKSIRFDLNKKNIEQVKHWRVTKLNYVPAVQLDEKIIIQRFGKPERKIKLKEKEAGWHYLYPDKGLDLILNEEGKEVLQYVPPKHFNLLLKPLQLN